MTRSITFWVTPFTSALSLDELISTAHTRTPRGFHGNLLVPSHFGPWPQTECNQSLPGDAMIGTPEDVARIRVRVERGGLGFGIWGVPVDVVDNRQPDRSIPALAASLADAAGYYAANFEPEVFWVPGDNPSKVDAWWGSFWNALADPEALSGNVAATVVPNAWGLSAFKRSLPNLAAGCGALALETYGGPATTATYASPNCWPTASFSLVRATKVDAALIPILHLDNLATQITEAARLGHGQVQVWAI